MGDLERFIRTLEYRGRISEREGPAWDRAAAEIRRLQSLVEQLEGRIMELHAQLDKARGQVVDELVDEIEQ